MHGRSPAQRRPPLRRDQDGDTQRRKQPTESRGERWHCIRQSLARRRTLLLCAVRRVTVSSSASSSTSGAPISCPRICERISSGSAGWVRIQRETTHCCFLAPKLNTVTPGPRARRSCAALARRMAVCVGGCAGVWYPFFRVLSPRARLRLGEELPDPGNPHRGVHARVGPADIRTRGYTDTNTDTDTEFEHFAPMCLRREKRAE